MLPCCRVAVLPCCRVAVLPCCRVAVLLCCRVEGATNGPGRRRSGIIKHEIRGGKDGCVHAATTYDTPPGMLHHPTPTLSRAPPPTHTWPRLVRSALPACLVVDSRSRCPLWQRSSAGGEQNTNLRSGGRRDRGERVVRQDRHHPSHQRYVRGRTHAGDFIAPGGLEPVEGGGGGARSSCGRHAAT